MATAWLNSFFISLLPDTAKFTDPKFAISGPHQIRLPFFRLIASIVSADGLLVVLHAPINAMAANRYIFMTTMIYTYIIKHDPPPEGKFILSLCRKTNPLTAFQSILQV